MPNSWSNSSILSPNRSILHRVYLVFDKWTDSGPDFSVFPESDLSTFIAWSGACRRRVNTDPVASVEL